MKLVCLLFLPVMALAQQSVVPQPNPAVQSFGRAWSVALTLVGWQTSGPTQTIVQAMNENGWASTDPGGCFLGCIGPTNFPRVRKNGGFDLDVSHRLSVRHGYQFSLGMPVNTEITGRSTSGPYLYLQSRIVYGSFRWAWFSDNGRLVGGLGPAVLLVQDFEKLGQMGQPRHSQLRPGLHLSGQFRFLNKRTWLLAVKVDSRLSLPATTGTYQRSGYTYSLQSQTGQQSIIEFPAQTISTSHINVGLQLGLKFL
jgi:hypothetical protein